MKKLYIGSHYSFREDTLENWIANNPVLEKGEPSIVRNPENESEWLKIGDGVTQWCDLPYRVGPQGLIGEKGEPFTYDDFTNEQLETLRGPKGDKGDRGISGVYLGSGEMPEGYNVQIDPDGETLTIEDIIKMVLAQTNKVSTVTLYANKWVGTASPYSQVVTISGTTENSKINLNPSLEQLEIFRNKDITFVVGNNKGIITVYCIGQKPTNDYTMQAAITEVKII